MKVIIAGSRDFDDFDFMTEKLNGLHLGMFTEIVSGKARGADALGERWAQLWGIPVKEFPAPWDDVKDKPSYQLGTRKDGTPYWKAAGSYRNQQMMAYADALVCFWNGESPGTRDMINQMFENNKEIHVFICNKTKS